MVEIGVPADHETTIDHDMELPTDELRPNRVFLGQKFVHCQAHDAEWLPYRLPGFEHRDTGICDGTQGVASVQVARFTGETPKPTQHSSDILFTFVLEGSLTLTGECLDPRKVAPSGGDVCCATAFHIPRMASAF